MTLLDCYTFIKWSNCGLNVKWSHLLVPLVKIVGRSKAEAAGDCGAFRSGGRLLEGMSHWGWGLGGLSPTPFPFHSS